MCLLAPYSGSLKTLLKAPNRFFFPSPIDDVNDIVVGSRITAAGDPLNILVPRFPDRTSPSRPGNGHDAPTSCVRLTVRFCSRGLRA